MMQLLLVLYSRLIGEFMRKDEFNDNTNFDPGYYCVMAAWGIMIIQNGCSLNDKKNKYMIQVARVF
jgi:hypothetical protein